jgi:hypothetical protein
MTFNERGTIQVTTARDIPMGKKKIKRGTRLDVAPHDDKLCQIRTPRGEVHFVKYQTIFSCPAITDMTRMEREGKTLSVRKAPLDATGHDTMGFPSWQRVIG